MSEGLAFQIGEAAERCQDMLPYVSPALTGTDGTLELAQVMHRLVKEVSAIERRVQRLEQQPQTQGLNAPLIACSCMEVQRSMSLAEVAQTFRALADVLDARSGQQEDAEDTEGAGCVPVPSSYQQLGSHCESHFPRSCTATCRQT